MVGLRVARLAMFGILIAVGSFAASYARPRPAVPITWLIFVDDLHIAFRDTGLVRKLLASIAAELILDGDSFIIRSSGPSSVSIPLGRDRAVLDPAISRVSGNELFPSDCLAVETDEELRYRAKLAAATATEMLNSLPSKRIGRAALLYISNGYTRLPVDATIAGVPRIAQESGVTVFVLNPRGLPRTPQVAPPGVPAQDRCYRDDIMMKSLRALAEPSGGFAVLEDADFADALQRIGRAMR